MTRNRAQDLPAEWVDPASLHPWDRNPRRITEEAIEQVAVSIDRFGFAAPVVAQRGSNRIIAGHTRVLAALKRGLPRVPVRFLALDDAAASALAIADNRLAEIVEWDVEGLDAILAELAEEGWDRTLLGFEQLLVVNEPPEAPEAPPVHEGPADSQPGHLYRLGDHVLVCGDSTDAATWALLDEERDGQGYDLVWTDPPYGVAYESYGTNARADGRQHAPIANDDLSVPELERFLRAAFEPAYERTRPGGVWYVASAAGYQRHAFGLVLSALPTLWKHEIVWRKDRLVLGRADRHYQHEPLFYGWKEGAGHTWTGGRQRTSVIDIPRPARSDEHPTMKPVALVEECLGCHREEGRRELVLDPFGGSGTTLMAAARLRMRAHTVELSPHYADVIRRRWTEYAEKAGLDVGDGL